MAHFRIDTPGTLRGHCKNNCDHIDCRQIREIVKALCPLCEEPLGYGVNLTGTPDDAGRLAHFECVYELETRRQEERGNG